MKNGPYELVIATNDYPGKRYRGKYCYEHQLVWWIVNKELPSYDELIHHKNGNKRDNRIENLECKSKLLHSKDHALESGRNAVKMICPNCLKEFIKDRRKTHLIKPNKVTFCSRRCIGLFNFRNASDSDIEKAISINVVRELRIYS